MLRAVTGGPFGIGFIPRPFAALAGQRRCSSASPISRLVGGRRRCRLSRPRAAGAQPLGPRAARHPRGRGGGAGARQERQRLPAAGLRHRRRASWGWPARCRRHFIGFIAPDNYLPTLTFQVWAMLIVGGSGNNRGAILGAVVVWGLWSRLGRAHRRRLPARAAGARRRAADRADRRCCSRRSCFCARAGSWGNTRRCRGSSRDSGRSPEAVGQRCPRANVEWPVALENSIRPHGECPPPGADPRATRLCGWPDRRYTDGSSPRRFESSCPLHRGTGGLHECRVGPRVPVPPHAVFCSYFN